MDAAPDLDAAARFLAANGRPHAPWWQPEPGLPASLLPSGQIAGTLHARGVQHPWLDGAGAWLWRRIDRLADQALGPYDMYGVLGFLEHVPDRDRAEAAFDRVGPLLLERGLVTLDPEAPGEVHGPLDFAPLPGSMARRLFDPAPIPARHGDGVAHAAQAGDQVHRAGPLGQPGARPGPVDGAGEARVVLAGPQHHRRLRLLPPQGHGGLDAVHARHVEIHEHHVWV